MRGIFLLLVTFSMQGNPTVAREPWQNYHDSFLGNYNLATERPQEAFAHYQQVLQATNSPYPYEGFLQLLVATGNYPAVVSLMPRLDGAFQENLKVQIIFIQALYETGNEQTADQRAITLQKKFKKSPEVTFMAAQAYGKGNPMKGVEVIDEFLNNVPFQQRHCLFYYLQSKLYEQLNNQEKAIELAQKSVTLCPHLQKRSVLSGMLKQHKEQVQHSGIAPVHKQTAQRLQRAVLHQGVQPKTIQLTEHCVRNSALLFEKQEYDAALTHINLCLRQSPEHEQAKLLKIQILTAQGKSKHAADLLKSWLEKEPHNQAWYQALYWLTYTGVSRQQVIKLLLGLEQKNKSNLHIQLYLADLYDKTDNLTAALERHAKACLFCDCPQMKTKILYHQALLQFEQGEFATAQQLMSKASELQVPYAPLDNLWAYFYSTKELNIPLAQQHITKALAVDPGNHNYLDTQALIWLKQGNYQKAAALLETLIAKEPANYAMHLHLAKVYAKLTDTKKSSLHHRKAQQLAKTTREKKAYQQLEKLLT